VQMDVWALVKKLFPDQYLISKNNNFNLLYGGSAGMMARLRGLDPRDQDVLDACQEEINAWNDLYTEIVDYQEYMVKHGEKKGWVPTISGRRCNVAHLLDPTRTCTAHKERGCKRCIGYGRRKCMNSPCQGSAADIVKVAMNLCNTDPKLISYKCRLLYPVHDELVFECPKRTAAAALKRVIVLMKKPFREEMAFDLDVEGMLGDNWQQAKG
jgi:DNA polymerase-1